MNIFHQCGHNFVWNIQSVTEDAIGDGLIISPVNVEADKITARIPGEVLRESWIDPQFYLPADSKGHLASYPFFPGNVLENFTTADYTSHAGEVAAQCLSFQRDLGLRSYVIPTRAFEELPEAHLEQLTDIFVDPFIEAYSSLGLNKPLILTVIAKSIHLERGILRDELLSWASGFESVDGIYLLYDNSFYSKQIKDPSYLAGLLRFVRALRETGLEVYVGYTGLEGLLLSAADPTSVSVGSYENLRSFGTLRLESRDKGPMRSPTPRVYSGRLLQWVEETHLPALRELFPQWRDLFDESPYKEFLLDPGSKLNFQRSELYKHYFWVFSRQLDELTSSPDRIGMLRRQVEAAISLFDEIRQAGIFMDPDSDGSHLTSWLNALAMYSANPE